MEKSGKLVAHGNAGALNEAWCWAPHQPGPTGRLCLQPEPGLATWVQVLAVAASLPPRALAEAVSVGGVGSWEPEGTHAVPRYLLLFEMKIPHGECEPTC